MRCELTDDEWQAITLLLSATLMGNPNSSGSGDFVHGLYVENNLPFRRQQSVFQHHVRISRIGEREDCTYAGFQLAAVNEFGDRAQPLGRHFHQEEGCGDLASQNTGRGGSGSAEAKAQQKEILRLLTEHGAT